MTLTSTGEIYSWGSSKNGVNGLGRKSEDVYLPEKIKKFRFYSSQKRKKKDAEIDFLSIYHLRQFYDTELYGDGSQIAVAVCADKNTFFIDKNGALFCSGSNQMGLLARDPEKNIKSIKNEKKNLGETKGDNEFGILSSRNVQINENNEEKLGQNRNAHTNLRVKNFSEIPIQISFFKKAIVKFNNLFYYID